MRRNLILSALLALAAAIMLTLAPAAPAPAAATQGKAVQAQADQALPPAPDYAQQEAWLVRPLSTPLAVDVFWVYPTVYDGEPILADYDNPDVRMGAEYTIIAQASVFDGQANIFAPLYRQANASILGMSPEDKARYLGVGQSDVNAAFAYYLEHLNQGRPFILAGHSQGSNLLTNMLMDRIGSPELRNMVAAYLIGWSVTADDLKAHPGLKVCRTSKDTGCVVTYNSVAPGHQDKAPTIMPGAISVNPLTWSTGGEPAPESLNLGAVFFAEDGSQVTRPVFTGATNRNGGLEVTPADPSLMDDFPFGPGIYHCYDYSLFYENLRENIAKRIKAWGK